MVRDRIYRVQSLHGRLVTAGQSDPAFAYPWEFHYTGMKADPAVVKLAEGDVLKKTNAYRPSTQNMLHGWDEPQEIGRRSKNAYIVL